MRSRTVLTVAAFILVALAGCRKSATPATGGSGGPSTSSEDGIRTAIQAHLAHRGTLNLKAFDTEVKQVTLDGDHAQAQVEFHVKNGPGMMQLTYALEKRDGAWSVVESKPVGSDFSHPTLDSGQVPAIGGQAGDNAALFDAVKNFKTRTGKPSQNLPSGHPPVNAAPQPVPQKTP